MKYISIGINCREVFEMECGRQCFHPDPDRERKDDFYFGDIVKIRYAGWKGGSVISQS